MNALIDSLNQASQTWWSYIVPAIWQGSLVALVIVGIVWIGRRWPSPLRHGLLLVALVKLAMPPLLALPTGVFFWLGHPSLATVSSETSATPPEAPTFVRQRDETSARAPRALLDGKTIRGTAPCWLSAVPPG